MEKLISKLTKEFQEYDKMLEVEQKVSNNEELTEDERWWKFMNNANKKNRGRSRIKRMKHRLKIGCAVKPCGKECAAWADVFIETYNHESMKNSKILVDDPQYLCHAAKRTPDPVEVSYFFYDYVNAYLKRDRKFKMEFLKSLYLNDNVLPLKSIKWFIKTYGFEKENEIITQDEEFYNELKTKLAGYEAEIVKPDLKQIKSKQFKKKVEESYINEKFQRKMRVAMLLSVFEETITKKKMREEALNNGMPADEVDAWVEQNYIPD